MAFISRENYDVGGGAVMGRTAEIYGVYLIFSSIAAFGVIYIISRIFYPNRSISNSSLFIAALVPATALTVMEMALGWMFPGYQYLILMLSVIGAVAGSIWPLRSDGEDGLPLSGAISAGLLACIAVVFVASPLAEIAVLKIGLNFVSLREIQQK